MKIFLNGQSIEVNELINLQEFLIQQQFQTTCFAVARNQQFIPKTKYAEIFLQAGDNIEIVTPMQGG